LIAYYFKIVTPIAVFANMIIVPYATLLTIWGITLAILGLLVPWLAPILGASNELVILIFFKINYLLAAIPGACFRLPQIPLIVVLAYYSAVAFLFLGVPFLGVPFAKRWVLR